MKFLHTIRCFYHKSWMEIYIVADTWPEDNYAYKSTAPLYPVWCFFNIFKLNDHWQSRDCKITVYLESSKLDGEADKFREGDPIYMWTSPSYPAIKFSSLLRNHNHYEISKLTRIPVYTICEQQKRWSACASTQSSQHLWCSLPR